MMPALLTRMSSRPSEPTHSSTTSAASFASLSKRSTFMAWKRRPSFWTRSPVSSTDMMSRAAMSAPASARPVAMPCPRPRAAPVTRATLPSRLKSSSTPTRSEVLGFDALLVAEPEVAFQLGEDVVLVDQVVVIVYVLDRPFEDEERLHLLDAFVYDERVDVARRLVDERSRPCYPVALQVVPGALEAETHDLPARVAVAVDLARTLDFEDVDPTPRSEVEPQGLEPDPLPLRHPGQLIALYGLIRQPEIRDQVLRLLLRHGFLLPVLCSLLRPEVEDGVRRAADLLDLRYDLAVEARHVGPVDFDEVACRIVQIHLDGPVGQLPDGRVTVSVPYTELLGSLVGGLEIVHVEREVMPQGCRVLVQEEVELQVPDPQPAYGPGEVGRGNLLHPEEVLVEPDRLLQVGGAYADVGEASGTHAYSP